MAMRQRSGPRTATRRRGPRYFTRRKVCAFCVNHVDHIDYKDISVLKRYVSDQFKIESRRKTGVCSKHQRALAAAIKRARHLAMMPFARAHQFAGMHRPAQVSVPTESPHIR